MTKANSEYAYLIFLNYRLMCKHSKTENYIIAWFVNVFNVELPTSVSLNIVHWNCYRLCFTELAVKQLFPFNQYPCENKKIDLDAFFEIQHCQQIFCKYCVVDTAGASESLYLYEFYNNPYSKQLKAFDKNVLRFNYDNNGICVIREYSSTVVNESSIPKGKTLRVKVLHRKQ